MTSIKKIDAKMGTRETMPSQVSPMLCTLVKEPVNDPQFLYEIKWDGYRIIAHVQKGKVRLNSRSALDYTAKYPSVAAALLELKHNAVFDGEVVVFNKEGLPDFDALQLYNGHNTPISYCVFDILWLDGYNLMKLPLVERKDILQRLLKGNKTLRFSESFDDGHQLYQSMLEKNLEGIVAKRKDSLYVPGQRANEWLKIPTRRRQEFVIGGWAESARGRAFRSLLFGAYENGNLKWIGRSGGGYKEKEMPGILKQLKELETEKSPFTNPVLDTKGAVIHWVMPELVANFEFATWTKSGRIRKPATFLGFRKDKKASQVVREVPLETPASAEAQINLNSNWSKVDNQKKIDTEVLQIEDCDIEFYNVDRQIWKGITKADLIHYYHQVADPVLFHIRNRPQSLHLKLQGPNLPGIYIKDMEGRQPACAEIFEDQRRHKSPGKSNQIDYLVCNNEATLLWMINLGCIDINPWSSKTTNPLHPDYLIIDVDPSEKKKTAKGLDRLRNTSIAAKAFFDEYGLTAFVKTSGKSGIHFLIPCSGLDFQQARSLAENICSQIHALVPDDSTINNSVEHRGEKVYIDPSQNDYADTIAAPYSVRPFHIPLVSTPLEWKEVNDKLDPGIFSMEMILKRLQKKGDLFALLYDKKIISGNNKQLKKF